MKLTSTAAEKQTSRTAIPAINHAMRKKEEISKGEEQKRGKVDRGDKYKGKSM